MLWKPRGMEWNGGEAREGRDMADMKRKWEEGSRHELM